MNLIISKCQRELYKVYEGLSYKTSVIYEGKSRPLVLQVRMLPECLERMVHWRIQCVSWSRWWRIFKNAEQDETRQGSSRPEESADWAKNLLEWEFEQQKKERKEGSFIRSGSIELLLNFSNVQVLLASKYKENYFPLHWAHANLAPELTYELALKCKYFISLRNPQITGAFSNEWPAMWKRSKLSSTVCDCQKLNRMWKYLRRIFGKSRFKNSDTNQKNGDFSCLHLSPYTQFHFCDNARKYARDDEHYSGCHCVRGSRPIDFSVQRIVTISHLSFPSSQFLLKFHIKRM